jgi:hypothetical protein
LILVVIYFESRTLIKDLNTLLLTRRLILTVNPKSISYENILEHILEINHSNYGGLEWKKLSWILRVINKRHELQYIKRGWEMLFEQLFFDSFLSLTHVIFLFSFIFFLPLLFLSNKKRGKTKLSKIIVYIKFLYLLW